jgi:hypothetical protein
MDYAQTHALFAQGKDAWNAWANEMLSQKKAYEDAGTWEAHQEQWEDEARAVFSDLQNRHIFNEFKDFLLIYPS